MRRPVTMMTRRSGRSPRPVVVVGETALMTDRVAASGSAMAREATEVPAVGQAAWGRGRRAATRGATTARGPRARSRTSGAWADAAALPHIDMLRPPPRADRGETGARRPQTLLRSRGAAADPRADRGRPRPRGGRANVGAPTSQGRPQRRLPAPSARPGSTPTAPGVTAIAMPRPQGPPCPMPRAGRLSSGRRRDSGR